MSDDGTTTAAYIELDKDCRTLIGIIGRLNSVIDALAKAFPGGVGVPDGVVEHLDEIDRALDDVYAKREEWR